MTPRSRALPRRHGQQRGKTESEPNDDASSLDRDGPRAYLILTPDLVIVDVSDDYARTTLTSRAALVGQSMFDVFPDNPNHDSADGVENLGASLQRVLQHGRPHRMRAQRYDIRDHVARKGEWV
jgi:hypothetical protein